MDNKIHEFRVNTKLYDLKGFYHGKRIHEEQLNTLLHHFHIIDQQKAFLANTYYDTADNYFTQQKMGLRVRQQDDHYTLTLKTDGKVSGGLHVRPEYNVELPT